MTELNQILDQEQYSFYLSLKKKMNELEINKLNSIFITLYFKGKNDGFDEGCAIWKNINKTELENQ